MPSTRRTAQQTEKYKAATARTASGAKRPLRTFRTDKNLSAYPSGRGTGYSATVGNARVTARMSPAGKQTHYEYSGGTSTDRKAAYKKVSSYVQNYYKKNSK